MQHIATGHTTACDAAVGWFCIFFLVGLSSFAIHAHERLRFHSPSKQAFGLIPKHTFARQRGSRKCADFLASVATGHWINTHAGHGFDVACPRRFIVLKCQDGFVLFCFTANSSVVAIALATVPCMVFGKDPPAAAPRGPPAGVCKRRPPWFCTGAKSRCRSSARPVAP